MMGRQSAQEDLFTSFGSRIMFPATTCYAGLMRC